MATIPELIAELRAGTLHLVPRAPTDAMMQAGLYQASHDAEWADVYSSWVDMVDTATEPDNIRLLLDWNEELVTALNGLVDCHTHFNGEPGHDAEVWAEADEAARAALSKASPTT